MTQQIVHNDIKPANIAYSPERGAVLFDFGVATSIKHTRHTAGTPWYIPPDVLDSGMRGAPGDVWALGVTMLYVLGKTRLPERVTRGWIMKDMQDKDKASRGRMEGWLRLVESDREILDCVSPVEGLVHRMLEPTRETRIQAAQVLTSLEGSR